MRIHILGIGGTFMGGVALLARDLGHDVSGSDAKVYPPMSTQLEAQGIRLMEGYVAAHLDSARPDLVIIGNALSRGNALVEAVLERGIRYTSGAQWIGENILRCAGTHKCRGRQDTASDHGRWVLAVAGTHGKTSTASMLAWILEHAKLKPGFLIGGVPENFGVSARLGKEPFFVIEADEYDTAFFDKRSKFVHYRPRTAILNNLEFDHADIFPDLAAIALQFHHFVRTVPGSGLLVVNAKDENLSNVLAMGRWTPVEHVGAGDGWEAVARNPEASRFQVLFKKQDQGEVSWGLLGSHNMANALAAIAAARHAGVPVKTALAALAKFRNVKRRLEVRGAVRGITVYDDFAHHPTAITATLEALRARVGNARILAVLELRSHTMRMGVHRDTLAGSLACADKVWMLRPADLNWNLERVTNALQGRGQAYPTVEEIIETLSREARPDDHILVMSNGGFGNIHARLLEHLQKR
ncbi:MAG: UDP-N-acetylmuramate:L-alanyl-gamma-D-glutamyl-meso-diaminopimelate ligase [Candidatus Muproteobacteria bacterium RIFCSPHIGHO2_12_FULL_60_33]|uniref:UDP-N-acetylmuramate--L-alanyl-gamma-D-glutamyl-meso-2,6-diaminoheptandioate ligase n=1 Tax=Candidatus Muproteobacteria bacterium RIFCSPLOWO2_01_FULL_60_18 TaxID=1817768 RepID=A0A1F6U170_9PROT|nr:MAG: UDP-N-acetylmuramate:L-alanyl-gamma-D-glutamyl-meso-diaminopimelate ligase [Candidatus Muproteobacteria bacterium RIFCSPLOWO2_01_FULL_60_18]OGI51641.1 MAG: UDP-N-acetylmuramate:L-alanyl-gamma-D-glutamyl-meso-diaminopimelate ligase [Candidatus Muproteobacteria bacterium RIFCSPHIGHO2_01_60_12]OGI54633.1 MAG: UDP-N-acetylmuramate:L-alanyl-gamma-D-glutamyl-meso-diaminopimelate ligase [Candidatus Muproteobacteria bacterium RIFCSPHIGHO2_02_FULL_60_13]OGI56145.1 MAG: UDP-N-acetylmuramate:L-alan